MVIIPTEIVGSLPRPQALQQAFADLDAGKISKDHLVAAQDKAAEDSVKRLEQTGEDLVTDGEYVVDQIQRSKREFMVLTRFVGSVSARSQHIQWLTHWGVR